jgi:hypothetical protein
VSCCLCPISFFLKRKRCAGVRSLTLWLDKKCLASLSSINSHPLIIEKDKLHINPGPRPTLPLASRVHTQYEEKFYDPFRHQGGSHIVPNENYEPVVPSQSGCSCQTSKDFHMDPWVKWLHWFLVWTYTWMSVAVSCPAPCPRYCYILCNAVSDVNEDVVNLMNRGLIN